MAAEQPVRDAFIEKIEAKIAAWTAVLDSYRAAVALDAPLGDAVGALSGRPRGAADGDAMSLPVGVFRDKGIKEAIPIFLRASRRKRTNKEIAVGLKDGGIASTSANFESSVATALGRLRDEGIVLRFAEGWDLAESYPDSLRSRLEREDKPRQKAAKPATSAAPAPKPEGPSGSEGIDKTAIMLEFIRVSGDPEGVDIGEIVDYLEAAHGLVVKRDYVRVVTRRLIDRQLVKMAGDRFYPA